MEDWALKKMAEVETGTVIGMAQVVVKEKGRKVFARWFSKKGEEVLVYTFEGLWEEAGLVAHTLRHDWGVRKGDRVVLCYDFGLHFFAAFLGCLRAGVVAVLVYPPVPPLTVSLPKMGKVIADCSPKLVLTDKRVVAAKMLDKANLFSQSRGLWPDEDVVPFRLTDNLSRRGSITSRLFGAESRGLTFDEPTIQQTDLAFLQYTSGSTGEPKGVMVTFGALFANVQLIHNGFHQAFNEDGGMPEELRGFSWLPQYHDLGLIYAAIAPFLGGWSMDFMSPLTFIQRPLLWLELMSRCKSHWGVGPDFAFRLAVRKFQEAKEKGKKMMPQLDLSCIHNLQNGTEPIRPDTRKLFMDAFAPYGLRENFFHSGYGLAEHVVGVCWIHGFHTSRKMPHLVAVGKKSTFDASMDVRIVDSTSMVEVAPEMQGELWISSPSVAAGYLGKSALSEEVFRARLNQQAKDGGTAANDGNARTFLRTGDIAFMEDDHLFICGRIKDLIIHGGVNFYPQDLEFAAQCASSAVRPGCVAAFSTDDVEGDGIVVIVFEIRGGREGEAAGLLDAIRSAVVREVGLGVSRVVAIREKSIPKTTSGKIQRRRTRELLHAGELFVVLEKSFVMERLPSASPVNGKLADGTADAKRESGISGAVHAGGKRDAAVAGVVDAGRSSLQPSADDDVDPPVVISFRNGMQSSELHRLSQDERRRVLMEEILALAKAAMGGEPTLGYDDSFMDAGMTSVVVAQFAGLLESSLQEAECERAASEDNMMTVIFDFPTVRKLAARVDELLFDVNGSADDGGDKNGAPLGRQMSGIGNGGAAAPLAVVGMACRFPDICNSPEAFWTEQ